ncbi:hypothetical protein SAMN05660350_00265 [Geodermatophilus obscurus]|uniref:RNA polymerase sigma-70 factor, ECF subfamily n=1 Tax=Geodermatophilus obscurus TaxID=1861 RepID=A0A1M7RYQ1_9ACTN|nr:hypothetical protein [Geodermatophilus obscurus]SHN51264.1 hypothetical protein SAMN05660350_00265 [Geodermatophilus obscurus]
MREIVPRPGCRPSRRPALVRFPGVHDEWSAALTGGLTLRERVVNGQLGPVAEFDGAVVTVLAFDVAGDRVSRTWAVRNPEKL